MTPDDHLPRGAAWQLRSCDERGSTGRVGTELAWFAPRVDGWRLEGCTLAVEDGVPWTSTYRIDVDDRWSTRRVDARARGADGRVRVTVLEHRRDGRWEVDGRPAPELDGCEDVDLESSACTNTLPIHRLRLAIGASRSVPAAYVRVDLAVERLEQRYRREPGADDAPVYAYDAPRFGFAASLRFDRWGLVVDYPGIAVRLA